MSRFLYRTVYTEAASTDPQNVLEGVALNAAAASRTYVIEPGGEMEQVIATVDLTRTSATSLTLTPTVSYNDGRNYDKVPAYVIASGTADMNDFSWSKTVGANDQLVGKLDVAGVTHLKLVVGGSSVTDTFDLRIVAIGRK